MAEDPKKNADGAADPSRPPPRTAGLTASPTIVFDPDAFIDDDDGPPGARIATPAARRSGSPPPYGSGSAPPASDTPSAAPPSPPPSSTDATVLDAPNPIAAAILSLFLPGAGQAFFNKQMSKGVVIFVLALCTGYGLGVGALIVAADAYLIAQRRQRGEVVTDWQFF